ncbi:HAMP domain-containing protein [Pedobacter sp. LMG 31464]|uniref:histidine kinase n=1 Tax=Pedobacter planticolens TaxID=2679964 RepID=A0A923DWD8_9SPHI|nr:ATP-binding protein [Pedobacter planticolens]MBB2144296.1 HAMP domain-containing protein [Pedobacter planticolens]
MKIKTKLRLGFGFLFLIIISFGGISLYQINEISVHAKVILKDNYQSLIYVNQMRTALDNQNGNINQNNRKELDNAITQEEKNVTETGEKEAVIALRKAFETITNTSVIAIEKEQAMVQVRLQLRNIDELNMAAIVKKNNNAQKATEKATLYLGITASITFIILFSFIVNFPGFIANPLRELLEGIKEISRKNYKQRLEFKGNDEFSELAIAFNKMAVELKNWDNTNVAQLKSEKQRIETIIEQMQDAIIGLNEKQEILFFNKVAGQLLNLNTTNVIGKSAAELAQKNELLKRVLADKIGEEPLKIYADEKESYFVLESREITIPNFDEPNENALIAVGKSAGKVYILKNITKFKELDEAKTNFIATVSHELKTPLSSIKMSLKLLNDNRVGTMNEEQTELVNHIKEDSERLLKITSELLDLAQVETGNLQLNFVRTNPSEIVNFALDAVRFQAQQKEIELELISKNTLPTVNADVQKTAWVLVNFLSNALRYSSAKSKVIVQVIEQGQFIEFSVKDFGKGIEEQYQKKLFDRYYQVPTDGQNKSGSGLGLAISKDFIEAENGKIWVESAIGEGSRFCFILPLA